MNRDAYSTPKEVFAVFNAEFNFAVDVAASSENALCTTYFSEERSALTRDWFPTGSNSWAGQYAWCNPPYSDIGPWVAKAAEQSAKGIGTVMLVMMDQSVGWYREAIKTCQEVRLVIGGRLSFIDPSTGKPAAGNNKGSMFIIWHPFGRTPVQYSHIERDEMLAAGRELLEQVSVSEAAEPEPEPQQQHNWPVEVKEIVELALDQCSEVPTEAFYNQLCDEANRQLLKDGFDKESIVADLVNNMLKDSESCAA